MNPNAAQVLVFDSGVGGLSIVQHLRDTLPAIRIDYLADNLYFPYGMMSDADLIDRVMQLIETANRQLRPDLIVIACNSASTLALPALREKITTPIVGVVPAIKPAAQLSQSKVIGLLATPGTIKRDYTDELIAEFAPGCEVIRVGSSQLVEIVEQQLSGQAQSLEVFTPIVSPFIDNPAAANMDTVVLACTHFPLVQPQLAAVLPTIKHWVDSGAAIARRVEFLLTQRAANADLLGSARHSTTGSVQIAWLTEASATTADALRSTLSQYSFNNIQHFEC